MTGMELIDLAAFDLRDHESLTGASHTLYPMREKLARLKSGLRFLATELARERCNRVMLDALNNTSDWPAQVVDGQPWLALPANCLAVLEVYIAGREQELGPLSLATRESRYQTGAGSQVYYLGSGRLYLSPPPDSSTQLRLVWAAWPALCQQAAPGDDAGAETQLNADLPAWVDLFAEELRQFIVLGCANRNEYDTTVEQGLFQMLKTAAAEVAAMEDLGGLDRAAPGGLWIGSEY
jgi:hypothetical protein